MSATINIQPRGEVPQKQHKDRKQEATSDDRRHGRRSAAHRALKGSPPGARRRCSARIGWRIKILPFRHAGVQGMHRRTGPTGAMTFRR